MLIQEHGLADEVLHAGLVAVGIVELRHVDAPESSHLLMAGKGSLSHASISPVTCRFHPVGVRERISKDAAPRGCRRMTS